MVFRTDSVDLRTSLTRAVCIARLQPLLDSSWSFGGNRLIIGSVNQTTLRAVKRIGYRNPFQTRLTTTLSDNDGGMRLHCRFGPPLIVELFMLFWFSDICLIGGLIFVVALAAVWANLTYPGGAITAPMIYMLIGPPVLLSGGVGFVRLGLYSARGERDFLLTFVKETLDAEEVRFSP